MSKQDLEVRRRTAVNLVVHGKMTYRQAAETVGAVPSSVSDWMKAYREKGEVGLRAIPEPKPRDGKLSADDKCKLAELLRAGPRANGFQTELWSLARIVKLVQREFGVSFHVGHMQRIVHGLGFSPQKPARVAKQQDPEAVKRFREEEWPELGKGRAPKGERSS